MITAPHTGQIFGDLADLQCLAAIRIDDPPDHRFPLMPPSTYHERVRQRRDPSLLSARAQRDLALKPEVQRVFDANFGVYACPERLP
jgi:hypothetical protein